MNGQNPIHKFALLHRLTVRRDQEGYAIHGKKGHIFEHDNSLLRVQAEFRSTRQCKHYCHRLQAVGCTVIQRGDTEISAAFDPSDAIQAQLAIRIAKIPRKRRVAPGSLAALERHRYIGQFRRKRAQVQQD